VAQGMKLSGAAAVAEPAEQASSRAGSRAATAR
jgi:hypothetical protein